VTDIRFCSPSRTPVSHSRFADFAYVFQNGRVQLAGTGAELSKSPEVRRRFLGH